MLKEFNIWNGTDNKNKNAEDKTTEIVFIIDRSGSMSGLTKETIKGFNSLLKDQRKESSKAIVTTVLFNEDVYRLHDRENIKKVPNLTEEEYCADGCTALYDALGSTIKKINKRQKAEGIKRKTIFLIITDGMENSSKKYTLEKIKSMIEKKQENKGWQFIFLGANIDAVAEAKKIGIAANKAARYEYSAKGTKTSYSKMSGLCRMARKCKDIDEFEECFEDDDLLDDIRID